MSKGRYLGIDIGGSKVLLGIVGGDGAIVDTERAPVPGGTHADSLMALVLELAGRLVRRNGAEPLEGAGVSIPGLADPQAGLWVYSPFSGIHDLPVADVLGRALGMPVAIENDVNACAVAERMFGGCRDVDDFVWVTVSNGIGAGVFIEGKLFRGSTLSAGEIGHIIVVENGNPCGCGRNGCLEAHASGRAIALRYRQLGGAERDARQIAAAARAGDRAAAGAYEEAGGYLGTAIACTVNILNPARVVLGGGVATDLDLFLGPLRKAFDARVFRQANHGLIIEQTRLAHNAGLIGAAAVAISCAREDRRR